MDSKTIRLLSKTVIRLPVSLSRNPGECIGVSAGAFSSGYVPVYYSIKQDHTWGTQDELEGGWFNTEIAVKPFTDKLPPGKTYPVKFIETVKPALLRQLGATSWYCYCITRLISQLSNDTDDRDRLVGYERVLKSDKRALESMVNSRIDQYNIAAGLLPPVTSEVEVPF